MIAIPIHSNDSPEFIKNIEKIIQSRLNRWRPSDFFITRIDNWFDSKWVQFSGTLMHEVSVWKSALTLPPFHPNRVEKYTVYRQENGTYQEQPSKCPLHLMQTSTSNLKRGLSDFSSNGLFIWYSGNTNANDKGSLMGYFVVDQEYFTFYLTFSRDKHWAADKIIGLTKKEIRAILETAER